MITDADIGSLSDVADQRIPGRNGGIRSAHICLYAMTPDNHFILDRHPDCNDVILASGFSGHEFKSAPVVGEILADLALDVRTEHPVGFLPAAHFFLTRVAQGGNRQGATAPERGACGSAGPRPMMEGEPKGHVRRC